MTLEADILKGKHFPVESRERLKAVMISLLVYLPGIVMAYDLYESIHYGYETIAIVEIVTMLTMYGFYLLFPRYINIDNIAKILLVIFTTFLLLTLFIPDYNAEFSLFWFATLPIVAFFFLGKEEGKLWTIMPLVGFIIIWLLASFNQIELLYNKTLLVQLIFSYLSVAYIMYVMEKERSMYEDKLNHSLKSNKLLFKEVHHRTKNNMQVMMGLLETQSFKIEDPKYKKMFHAHVDRIKSMSFVHENLYKGDSYGLVDMHKYLSEILNNLQKITQHTIITDIDYVTLDIKDSISLGLIVNEAVSNAIEHAYSAGVGRIDVTLKNDGKQYVLNVKDDGIGFNTQKEFQSLGMTLIEDLSISLPNGRLEISIDMGTRIQVYFDVKGKI
jgi:two-component sensor histidine kinase